MSVHLWERYFAAGRRAGCPKDQMQRFERALSETSNRCSR